MVSTVGAYVPKICTKLIDAGIPFALYVLAQDDTLFHVKIITIDIKLVYPKRFVGLDFAH